ncbi:hypothetical protein [Streptomyces sp. NPDC006335]|uniref:hypothetical protein n=1 Tax=Streptomyces sp. NPDC006335 TaxID=3156895 RepID=UPI0033A60911
MPPAADADPIGPNDIPGALAAVPPPQVKTDVKVAFEQSLRMVAGEDVTPLTRERVWAVLEGGAWQGNISKAARVAAVLVENAVRHGGPFPDGTISLRIAVDAESRELILEVEDAFREFPGFPVAAQCSDVVWGRPHGLWWISHYKGRLAWTVKTDQDTQTVGKCVQVILPVS